MSQVGGYGSGQGGRVPGPPRHQPPTSQHRVQPSVKVRTSMAPNRGGNQLIPDLGKLVRSEADNNERNKRQSNRMQGHFDVTQIADGGRTRSQRRSIKGKKIKYSCTI